MKIASRINRKRKGFTLIELLIVILILAILMAVALPLYLAAVSDSEKKTCQANLQTIANAEQAYKVRSADHTYTTALNTLCGATGDLQAVPTCPSGGAYSVSGGTSGSDPLVITCTKHGSFTPGTGVTEPAAAGGGGAAPAGP